MEFAASTMLFAGLELERAVESILEHSSFRAIEISHSHLERVRIEEWRRVLEGVRELLEAFSARVAAAHLPADRGHCFASDPSSARELARKLAREAETVHRSVGCTLFVVHTLFYYPPSPRQLLSKWVESLYRLNRAFLEELDREARSLGVAFAVENRVEKHLVGHLVGDLLELVEGLEGIGLCIDLGHAHANGLDLREVLESSRDRVLCYHIHDNDGTRDQHLPPYMGSIRWDEVAELMRRDRVGVLEVSCQLGDACRGVLRLLELAVMSLQRAEG